MKGAVQGVKYVGLDKYWWRRGRIKQEGVMQCGHGDQVKPTHLP